MLSRLRPDVAFQGRLLFLGNSHGRGGLWCSGVDLASEKEQPSHLRGQPVTI